MMKIPLAILAAILAAACTENDDAWLNGGIRTARLQLSSAAEATGGTGELPRSVWSGYDIDFLSWQLGADKATFKDSLRVQPSSDRTGHIRTCGIHDWTSGFFPGSLWYAYGLTGDSRLKRYAEKYTSLLNPVRHYSGTHDIGFMIGCSYGNALKLSPADTIRNVIIETADNLCSRFNPDIGCIRSWDFGKWNYPVIIDNMMNLELLFSAYRLSGQDKYRDIAVTHANTTMKNHFRPDFTCWHVVSYNDDGTVECRETFQGRSDGSSWSRGQAWAVYGYTVCFRETGDSTYLHFAENIADMIMSMVHTDDCIPYWDYDAPVSDRTPRDASAAAITASGLLELSRFSVNPEKYFGYAEKVLKSLSSPQYLAKPGTNEGFILMHSTGSLPHGSEIDVPLNYADYYYMEGLKRYKELKGLQRVNFLKNNHI